MNLRLSVPSKTFLSGEYAVLAGGLALVLNTAPRFVLSAKRSQDEAGTRPVVHGIPAGSPAEGWLRQREPLLRDWTLEFLDPHEGHGGFGASSAQFTLLHVLTTFLQISVSRAVAGLDVNALWNDFRVFDKGSGADCLAQIAGEVALVNVTDVSAVARVWPFADLDFAILRTGNKIQTHSHLGSLDREPLKRLVAPAAEIVEFFTPASSLQFARAVNNYGRILTELNLQEPATLAFLASLRVQPWCKAVKGCGAMGADTMIVFYAPTDALIANEFFATLGLEVAAQRHELNPGLQMDWNWQPA